MNQGVKTIIYPVTDIARAKTLFTSLLGVAPAQDQPYYVGFRVGDQDVGPDPMVPASACLRRAQDTCTLGRSRANSST